MVRSLFTDSVPKDSRTVPAPIKLAPALNWWVPPLKFMAHPAEMFTVPLCVPPPFLISKVPLLTLIVPELKNPMLSEKTVLPVPPLLVKVPSLTKVLPAPPRCSISPSKLVLKVAPALLLKTPASEMASVPAVQLAKLGFTPSP